MAVAEVFFSMKGHPGIEMVISQVRKKYPGIGDATVYRTMRLLVEAGLAIPRDFGEGFTRYEAYDDDKNHNHLVCSGCGAIIEFVAPELDEILTKIALEHEFLVNQHRVEIFGLCKKCQELKADSDRKQATKHTKKR
jgi:Fur family ferric uptake transcriptional regulator